MDLGQPHRRQPGALLEHARQHLPQRQLSGKARAEGWDDAQTAGRLVEGPDGADRGTLNELDLLERAENGQVAFVAESEFEGGDFLGVVVGEVDEIAFADMGAVAVGLAEEDGGVDLAVGGGPGSTGDVHVHMITEIMRKINSKMNIYDIYTCLQFEPKNPSTLLRIKSLSQEITGYQG